MKRYVFLLLTFFLCSHQLAAEQQRKRVAVVLSGGGAKGVAHIGALKVIEEAGIPVDYVVGTSMGSIIGGLYSIGHTPAELDSMVRSQNWSFLLSDRIQQSEKTFRDKVINSSYLLSVPFDKTPREAVPNGIIRGQNLENLFTNLTVGYHDSISFNQLPIPFACVAVDLHKGQEVVFHSGVLAKTMRASMAIPGAFTPVRLDSMVLVDGGLINNFPVDVALEMGADIVIGVDVQSETKPDDQLNTLPDMVMRIVDISAQTKNIANRSKTDLHIQVDVEGYSAASFSTAALDTLTRRGEEAARAAWDELIALKQRIGISDDFSPHRPEPYDRLSSMRKLAIRRIQFQGLTEEEEEQLRMHCEVPDSCLLSIADIQEITSRIYATQQFANVNYSLTRVTGGYNLAFTLEDNQVNTFNIGLRFDSEEQVSVLANVEYYLSSGMPLRLSATGRIGKRTGIRAGLDLLPHPLRSVGLSYAYQYNDLNIYRGGNREYNATFRYHLGEVAFSNIFNQDMMLGFGIRFEHFNYTDFLFSNDQGQLLVPAESFFSYFLQLRRETTDQHNYPTKGSSLQATVSAHTDNLVRYKDDNPFVSTSLWWKSVYSLSKHTVLIPAFYGRVMIGDEIPYPYWNVLGGDIPGKYMPQQLPFIGIGYFGTAQSSLLISQLQLRRQLSKNNYVNLTANYAHTDNNFFELLKGKKIFGVGLGYSYNSIIGPLEAILNWSTETKKPSIWVNVGYTF